MNAKHSDLARIQEIWDVATQTKEQIRRLDFTQERFMQPANDTDDLIAEGLMNRILRITEEAGKINEHVAEQYGFERRAANGVRNRLAHAYGDIDRSIIWQVIKEDLDPLLDACRNFAEDLGIELK